MTGTLIIPVYNRPELLKECINSINTSFPENTEVIIIDNNSDNPTKETINNIKKEYPIDFKIISNNENKGFAYAVNQGIGDAEGDWIGIINSDTVYNKKSVERLLYYLENDKNSLIGPVTNYTGSRQIIDLFKDKEEFLKVFPERQKDICYEAERITGFALFGHKKIFDKTGEFDIRFEGGNFEDDDYVLRCLINGYKVKIANDVFVEHRGHSSYSVLDKRFSDILERNRKVFIDKWSDQKDNTFVKDMLFFHSKDEKYKTDSYYSCLNYAIDLYQKKMYKESYEELQKIEHDRADDPFLFLFLGLNSFQTGHYDNSLDYLEKSKSIRFFDRDLYIKLAHIYNEKHDFQKLKENISILHKF